MPAFYAHDRFGTKVLEQMNGEIKDIIEKYNMQFRIGLQGPDIFFFYKPYKDSEAARYGNHLHAISARPFFLHGAKVIRNEGRDSGQYAYLLGVLCHFILDSECHPYIGERMTATGVGHLEIEEEFEKKLLRLDQRDPFAYALAELVPEAGAVAGAIEPFYGEMDRTTIEESLIGLKRVKRLFTAPGAWKRSLINTLLKLTGKYPEWKGLMNQRVDHPDCKESNEELLKRFDSSVDIAVKMMKSLDETIQTKTELNSRFDRTFE